MSAQLLCASCFQPIEADDLTQAIVLGAGYQVGVVGLVMETAIVHVDCRDPRGEFVYDCRRRYAHGHVQEATGEEERGS